ncbi:MULTISPECIES: lipoyl synthase [Halobacteriovorax]|uniref:Lipoyl synthase n=1 Tax=Halobacteriovorax vibrionivorans TaxID=2152716 RepID=A0ABY0IFW7_9BACT|nr:MULTISPECIES: lipoyl synthase [Halobacteriovorax]AYF44080.1 lipoyl synthase [Halobacteriovorax sp. BALOs_7]RZF21395.1 lipoyl synthase [Halobacteriovorax vibrionivorans]TGD46401.1 lipoyl synthase [Halobacteriovorax sp. Y22]
MTNQTDQNTQEYTDQYEAQRQKIQQKKARLNIGKEKEARNLERKPEWLRVGLPTGDNFKEVRKELREKKLFTVCEEASCPNMSECWSAKTATMMILGGTCTRACKFCHVDTGNPKGVVDFNEIENAAKMVETMSLKYLVVTSVDRDDLPDFGAGHFANVVKRINKDYPDTLVEVLIPDFNGESQHMDTLAKSNPFVIAQNIETVKRLTHDVRDRRAGYEQTLNCLKYYKENYPHIATKSSIMLGLGETHEEILETMQDLKNVGCDIVTLGQYMRPTMRHLKVERYYKPQEFEHYKKVAYEMGFEFVASGPLVRSSYKAADYLDHLRAKGHDI